MGIAIFGAMFLSGVVAVVLCIRAALGEPRVKGNEAADPPSDPIASPPAQKLSRRDKREYVRLLTLAESAVQRAAQDLGEFERFSRLGLPRGTLDPGDNCYVGACEFLGYALVATDGAQEICSRYTPDFVRLIPLNSLKEKIHEYIRVFDLPNDSRRFDNLTDSWQQRMRPYLARLREERRNIR